VYIVPRATLRSTENNAKRAAERFQHSVWRRLRVLEPRGMTADHPRRRRRCPAAQVEAFARHVAAAHFDVMLARARRAATGEAEPATVAR